MQAIEDVVSQDLHCSVCITLKRCFKDGTVFFDRFSTTIRKNQHLVPEVLVEQNGVQG